RGRRGAPRGTGWVLLLLAVLGALVAGRSTGWSVDASSVLSLLRPGVFVEVDGRSVAVPQPPATEGRPLPAVPVTTEGSHAFLHLTPEGRPVGYDPCRPIVYVVRADGAPGEGQALVEEAIAVVQAATGLLFVPGGATQEAPVLQRPIIQPDRYGTGWAPVLVAWSDESEVVELAGQVAGLGGSAAVPGADGTGQWLAAGRLVLDAPDLAEMLTEPRGHERARAIVVHELGHVLGLDHVEDPGELMNPSTGRIDLGPGDLQGLALVGDAACQ
ncbi:MAG TPA: matrixin family metalloprotease, partial [Actinotalea sp.]|nr:matrixin family metalloprotease [Actinotalea sp.]